MGFGHLGDLGDFGSGLFRGVRDEGHFGDLGDLGDAPFSGDDRGLARRHKGTEVRLGKVFGHFGDLGDLSSGAFPGGIRG